MTHGHGVQTHISLAILSLLDHTHIRTLIRCQGVKDVVDSSLSTIHHVIKRLIEERSRKYTFMHIVYPYSCTQVHIY